MITRWVASLAGLWARTPKIALFGAAALVQLALLSVMIVDRVQILRDGNEVTLRSRPVDPRDLLRGDYVILGYDISQLPAGALLNQPASSRTRPRYSSSPRRNRDGIYEAVSVHAEPVGVTTPEVLIRGTILDGGATCGSTRVCLLRKTLDSPLPRKLFRSRRRRSQARRSSQPGQLSVVVLVVLPSGRAAIKRLFIDGKPVYEEPWSQLAVSTATTIPRTAAVLTP